MPESTTDLQCVPLPVRYLKGEQPVFEDPD
jgi:hypothetical protein